ncbi:hypothetical protein [Actinoplanes sp. TFC3]|uniref:hypothetical protein n=1 Tax=Actinoplanes sp. TFC3 TaxID=1710355 RepID=UPI000AEE43E9|nr:hypothetical protein [Actinoplanes sp. TFC3]
MLRNDLITLLAQHDNDTVTVTVNGHAVDVDTVAVQDESITIVLDADGLRKAVAVSAS